MSSELTEKHIAVIVDQLDEKIARLKKQLHELEETKAALRSGLGSKSPGMALTNGGGSELRLGVGVPKKWVEEALQTKQRMSIGLIMKYTERVKGRRLRDASIRRALSKFLDSGQVVRNDDGSWSWKKEYEKDDDLPF